MMQPLYTALVCAAILGGSSAADFCPASCLADAHYCRNSVNGTGPNNAADPNPVNNMCEECMDGFKGLECEMCTSDVGCVGVGINDGAKTCFQTNSLHDENPGYMQCELQDPIFVQLLGNGRDGVSGKIAMQWNKPTGWIRSDKDGTMDFKFYRTEPPTGYLNKFFQCQAQKCSMTAKRQKVGKGIVHEYLQSVIDQKTLELTPEDKGENVTQGTVKEENLAQRMTLGGWVLSTLLGVTSAVLCLAGTVNNGRTRRRVVVAGTVVLVLELAALIMSIMVSMQDYSGGNASSQARNGTSADTYIEITYTCDTTSCGCALPDPNDQHSWQPKCVGSLFSDVLAGIREPFHIICDNTTSSERVDMLGGAPCVFSGDDLLQGQPMLLGCHTSQCVADSFLPGADTDPNAHVDVAADNSKSLGYVYTVIALVIVFCALVICHYIYSMRISQQNVREWRARYHLTGSNPGSPHDTSQRDRVDSLANGEELYSVVDDDLNSMHIETSPRGGSGLSSLHDQKVQLQTRLLSYHIGTGTNVKRILNKITLELPPGKSLAIMGPSGAGKTTLLDLLAARDKRGVVTGSILMNGTPISHDEKMVGMYRDVIGYVSQEDSLIPSLTVMESVMYSARLRLPKGMPDSEKVQRAEQVISDLGLAHCKDSRIGGKSHRGISGGEKRRVSIAMELVANPRILFLDEPTSGLDSYNALVVMQTIARMKTLSAAAEYSSFFNYQTTVVFSIHQPSKEIFDTFDNLMLLSKGQLLYCGVAEAALATFGRLGYRAPAGISNPSDFLLKIANTMSPNERSAVAATAAAKYTSLLSEDDAREVKNIIDMAASETASITSHDSLVHGAVANNSLNGTALDASEHGAAGRGTLRPPGPLRQAAENKKYYVNFYEELKIVGQRGFKSLLGNYYLVMCHIVVTLALVGILFTFYSRQPLTLPGVLNRAGCFSFTMILLGFSSMSSLELFLTERDVYTSERNNGYYGSLSYFITKLVFDIIPLRIVPPLLLGTVSYNQMGLRTDDPMHFVCFITVLTLFNIITAGVSMNAAMVTSSFGAGVLLASLLMLTFFAFDPLIVQGDTLPAWVAWVRFFSPFFLSFEVLMVNELHGQQCTFAPTSSSGEPSKDPIPIPCNQYLTNLGLHVDRFGSDLSLLVVWTGIYLFLAWFCLHFLVKEKR